MARILVITERARGALDDSTWELLAAARALVSDTETIAIGLLFRNPEAPRYDQITVRGLGMSSEDKLAALDRELDRFAI